MLLFIVVIFLVEYDAGQEFMENESEAFQGVAYPGVRDNRSTVNIKTGYDEYDDDCVMDQILLQFHHLLLYHFAIYSYNSWLTKQFLDILDLCRCHFCGGA